jgi:Flp pilus assembly protein protease CpaA
MNHDVKTMTDGAAVVMGLGGFLGWMTPVVTLIGGVLTIVWMVIRIWETDTVQRWAYQDAVNRKKDVDEDKKI